jgi:hypothetical protein
MVAIDSSSQAAGAVPDGTVVVGAVVVGVTVVVVGVVVVVVGASVVVVVAVTEPVKDLEIEPDALDAVIVKL